MEKLDRLKEIIAENLGVEIDEIKSDSKLIDDLGADSIDIVELSMAIEDEFEVSISDDKLETIVTVEDILKNI